MIPSLMILTGSLIIALETDRMAHVGKVAVAIAKGER